MGQATEFILNEYADKKITKTSFLDDSFRKNLESALRFGNPLLVQDVENYDPILNPVLNRELKRTGGRVLITLGDQDIDLSPSFTIFLSTRDPTVEFSPDICSRSTNSIFLCFPFVKKINDLPVVACLMTPCQGGYCSLPLLPATPHSPMNPF